MGDEGKVRYYVRRENEMLKLNPFKPGSLTPPGMFTGRLEELRTIERALGQTRAGVPTHFLIHGERGIGKSSLLLYVKHLAQGGLDPIWLPEKLNFIVLNISLERSDSYVDVIKKIAREFELQVSKRENIKEFAKGVFEFIGRWKAMGIEYRPDPPKQTELLEEVTAAFETAIERMGIYVDGVLILIDEADKPGPEAGLGAFCKLFTERLTNRGVGTVCIGMAGVSPVVDILRKSHESSPRVFELMGLEPLTEEERIKVLHRGLDEAEQINKLKTTISQDAEIMISQLSEGYPHFVQQFAYCAFNADSDNDIDLDDVLKGANDPQEGALEQLASKYFHELYFDQIGSDEYRQVLRAMADHLDGWVTKEDIRKATHLKETTLGNAIAALRSREIIIPKRGVKGVYRLPTQSFAVWIRAYTARTTAPKT